MLASSLIPLRSHPGNRDRTARLVEAWNRGRGRGAIYQTARGYLVTVSTRTPAAGPVNMALPGFFATRGEAEAATERWEEK